jgi:hypothetical protein
VAVATEEARIAGATKSGSGLRLAQFEAIGRYLLLSVLALSAGVRVWGFSGPPLGGCLALDVDRGADARGRPLGVLAASALRVLRCMVLCDSGAVWCRSGDEPDDCRAPPVPATRRGGRGCGVRRLQPPWFVPASARVVAVGRPGAERRSPAAAHLRWVQRWWRLP